MSTKPKAKKFRIRRSGPLGSGRPKAAQDQAPEAQSVEDGFDGPRPAIAPKTHLDDPAAQEQQELGIDREIAEIRKEGLTGRQLRMARRMAMKYGLAPTSDFDAVRLLRKRGIDPFQRANLLEVVPNGQYCLRLPGNSVVVIIIHTTFPCCSSLCQRHFFFHHSNPSTPSTKPAIAFLRQICKR